MAARITPSRRDPLPHSRSVWERWIGRKVAGLVAMGKQNPDTYEGFSVQRLDFRQGTMGRWPPCVAMLYRLALAGRRWKCQPHNVDDDAVWLCFSGLSGVLGQESFSIIPRRIDLIPKSGTAFVFNGPTAIAGYSPEQCIRVTEKVYRAAASIVENRPAKRIRVFCFSAGTHLGFYVANQLGRTLGQPIDKFVAVSPGVSIAYGIFSTWVTKELATDLERRGITKEIYDQAIRPYTQRENLKHLPSGGRLVVHAGTADSFIPIDKAFGTNDLVERLRGAGKNPTYIVHRGKNHVTLALTLMLAEKSGCDPHFVQADGDV
jgi:hypothetical protein